MILIYEPFSMNLEHVPVNTQFIEIIDAQFCNEKKLFLGEHLHISNIKREAVTSDVDYKEIRIISSKNKIKALLNEWRNVKKLAKRFDGKLRFVFIMNSHPHTMFFVKKFFKASKVLFVVHGSLEEILRRKKPWQLGFYNKMAFSYKNTSQYRYIVLGDSIKRNALKQFPFLEENLYAVPHPYRFDKIREKCKKRKILRFGTIGTGSTAKQSEMLFAIEKKLCLSAEKKFELCHIGSYLDIEIPSNTTVQIYGGGTGKLSLADYNSKIQALDYILFFFPASSYKLTASGALCDAIAHGIPVIAIENDYFRWVFQEVGNIGYLCKDIDEMVAVIQRTILEQGGSDYNEFVANIKKARILFSKENVMQVMNEKKIWFE